MSTLFPLTPVFPPGFSYLPEFLTVDEEKFLIASIQHVEQRAQIIVHSYNCCIGLDLLCPFAGIPLARAVGLVRAGVGRGEQVSTLFIIESR
jgi:hypothetical protein